MEKIKKKKVEEKRRDFLRVLVLHNPVHLIDGKSKRPELVQEAEGRRHIMGSRNERLQMLHTLHDLLKNLLICGQNSAEKKKKKGKRRRLDQLVLQGHSFLFFSCEGVEIN